MYIPYKVLQGVKFYKGGVYRPAIEINQRKTSYSTCCVKYLLLWCNELFHVYYNDLLCIILESNVKYVVHVQYISFLCSINSSCVKIIVIVYGFDFHAYISD